MLSQREQFNNSSNSSGSITSATKEFTVTPTTDPSSVVIDISELRRVKSVPKKTRIEVARMNQELETTLYRGAKVEVGAHDGKLFMAMELQHIPIR
jgi:hypothetical protein